MTEKGPSNEVLDAKQQALKDRIEKLEGNQRWTALALIGALFKMLFDLISKGQP